MVATTSSPEAIKALGLDTRCSTRTLRAALTRVESENVLAATGAFGEDDGEKAAEFLTNATPMKSLLRAVQIAKALTPKEERKWGLDPVGDAWTTALKRVGLAGRGERACSGATDKDAKSASRVYERFQMRFGEWHSCARTSAAVFR